jgi:biotin carboxylase
MRRVLLLAPAAGYGHADFARAAARLGAEVVVCADYCPKLAPDWGLAPLMSVPFDQPEIAVPRILGALAQPPDAVIASDDHGTLLAARLQAALGLRGNPPEAVATLTDKLAFRRLQARHGLPHPAFCLLADDADAAAAARSVGYPLVVKARRLNASRGVIRADDPAALVRAVARVRRIQARADREGRGLGVLLERYLPGTEIALEGVLLRGRLQVLALFDKPDPLVGPYFEETIYVTPSRLPAATQDAIAAAVARACAAAGLVEGPLHAEARVNDAGVWLLEIAPRGIGGLCGRSLTTPLGMSSAEIVLRHALDLPLPAGRAGRAAGVMMIPVPRRGVLRAVGGVEDARAVPGIDAVEISAVPGQIVAPAPEGASYLGFLFSAAATPARAEAALRAAHAHLRIDIQPLLAS